MNPNKKIKPLILGFCASSSGSGKTTLIEKIIPILKANSLIISVVKHAHHSFDIDTPGKSRRNFKVYFYIKYRLQDGVLVAWSKKT